MTIFFYLSRAIRIHIHERMTFFFFTNPEAYGLASTNAGNFVYLESNGDRREGSAVSPAELRFGE